jgi:hypothetical protein
MPSAKISVQRNRLHIESALKTNCVNCLATAGIIPTNRICEKNTKKSNPKN